MLSKNASKAGGVEEFLANIFDEGYRAGKSNSMRTLGIIGIGAFVLGGLAKELIGNDSNCRYKTERRTSRSSMRNAFLYGERSPDDFCYANLDYDD